MKDVYFKQFGRSSPHLIFLFLHGLKGESAEGHSREKKCQKFGGESRTYQHPFRLRRFGSGAPGLFGRGIIRRRLQVAINGLGVGNCTSAISLVPAVTVAHIRHAGLSAREATIFSWEGLLHGSLTNAGREEGEGEGGRMR